MEMIKDLIDMLSDELTQMMDSELVEGTAIELNGVTIVPISIVSVGVGGGGLGTEASGGDYGDRQSGGYGKGEGMGMGGGGTVRPVAVAIFTKDNVEVVEIPDPRRSKVINKLSDKIPELIEKMIERRNEGSV
ncbi:MAG: hypothetical protein JKY24_07380 [Pseudomonadales bacterium]|nr:hypothetical protein [Pseudomonadales bacterium]